MRNYPNFLEAYLELNKDQFVPDKFHFWTGVSILAGALERKVWLPWTENFSYYPNLYILLVSHPGIGKSSAINPGVNMLREISADNRSIKFIPSQVTEAKLIELMRHPSTFDDGTKTHYQCAGYYPASEASASLKNLYGDFIATVTGFYDCDKVWEKATMGMKDETFTIVNACFNLIAGCTFDYLGKLITEDNIMGGFASRITYIIQKEAMERQSPWQNRGFKGTDKVTKTKLMEDLYRIHNMVGTFTADEGFKKRWEIWFPEFDSHRQSLKSEKLQSLMVRKSTTLLKLCMIISAAESDSLVMTEDHWDRAMELTDDVEKDLPAMIREGQAKNIGTQVGLNSAIFKILTERKSKSMDVSALRQDLVLHGYDQKEIDKTLSTFNTKNDIFEFSSGQENLIKLVSNPDDYL